MTTDNDGCWSCAYLESNGICGCDDSEYYSQPVEDDDYCSEHTPEG
jgi:hypothetical protein